MKLSFNYLVDFEYKKLTPQALAYRFTSYWHSQPIFIHHKLVFSSMRLYIKKNKLKKRDDTMLGAIIDDSINNLS